MSSAPTDRWVIVASYKGLDGDLRADLLLTTLQGLDIPAQRFPRLPTTCLPMASWPMIRAVHVAVPVAWEEEASGIVADQPSPPMRPQLRAFFQWCVAFAYVGLLANVSTLPGMLRDMRRFEPPGWVTVAGAIVVIMGLRAFVALNAALFREGRLRPDARPLVVGVLAFGVLALLDMLLQTGAHARLSGHEQAAWLILVACAAALIARGTLRRVSWRRA